MTHRIIGKPRRRVDGRAKVTGQTRFADDIMLPRMLHCKLLRSTHPHARIVRIDTSRAAALDGRAPRAHGRGASDSVRHPAGQPRRARALPRRGALRRRSGGGGDRARRGDRASAPSPDRRRVRAAARRSHHPRTAWPIDEPRIHDYGDLGNIHKAVALQFGDVDGRSPARITCSTTRSSSKATRTCRSSSTPRSRRRIRTASSSSIRARRRRTTCTARWRRRWRCRPRTFA